MGAVQSRRKARKTRNEVKKKFLQFLIFTVFYAIFLMWVSGMTAHYYPEPIGIGWGQYIDLQIGLLIIGGTLYFMIMTLILRKTKRRVK